MNHEDLKGKLLLAMPTPIPLAVRSSSWAKFLDTKATEYHIQYDHIADKRFYDWLRDCEDIDWHDGAQGITVWICNFGREGH